MGEKASLGNKAECRKAVRWEWRGTDLPHYIRDQSLTTEWLPYCPWPFETSVVSYAGISPGDNLK